MVITMYKKAQSALLISFAVQAGDVKLVYVRLRWKQGSINSNTASIIHSHRRLWVPAQDFHCPVKNVQIMSASLHITELFGQIITSKQL